MAKSLIPLTYFERIHRMKFSVSFLALALTGLLPASKADFHVLGGEAPNAQTTIYGIWAVASNQYNCDGLGNAANGAQLHELGTSWASANKTKYFNLHTTTQYTMCGEGNLNFYRRTGQHWQVYVPETGALIADCYKNSGPNFNCGSITFRERLLCYSQVCKS
jgi:hypothetical protein